MIYLDYAATSWPKAPEVTDAMLAFLEKAGGNPGRSGHSLSIAAGRAIYETREALAELVNLDDPLRVIFTLNATEALNLVLMGLLKPGARVLTSSIEHNSVMRPLRHLQASRGIDVATVHCDAQGRLDLGDLASKLNTPTQLVILTHASNVCGTILPVGKAAAMAHAAGALLAVDAAQTLGILPLDMRELGIDLLVFSGHKALGGPPGVGGLVLGDGFDPAQLEPLVRGGTGSRSEHEEQPTSLPDKYESGTPNGVGIAGLGAGVRMVLADGVAERRAHDCALCERLLQGIAELPNIRVYGPGRPDEQIGNIALTVAGQHVSEVGWQLDQREGILSRVGLHCAPAAHRTLGTFPEGCVRLSVGAATTAKEVDAAIAVLARISRS